MTKIQVCYQHLVTYVGNCMKFDQFSDSLLSISRH